MKTISLNLFIGLIFLINYRANSQANNSSVDASNHKQIYIFLGNIGTESDSLVKLYDIKPIFLIGGNAIDPYDRTYVDSASLTANIKRVIPDVNATGIAILDWEGNAMQQLGYSPLTDPNFVRIVDEYKKMVVLAKALRPKILWGIYALPLRNYWSRNKEWKTRAFMLESLMKNCDVIAPSVYQFYSDSLLKEQNESYIKDNVALALQIGKSLNKPVFPFVTHRFQNLKTIPKDQFVSDIDYIFKTQYLGKFVDGIIWWGPDQYYYQLPKNNAVKDEVKSGITFKKYFSKLVYGYLSSIVQLRSFWNN